MADRNEQVMELVVRELERNPDAELGALYDKARELDPAIGDLSLRQFHARYPLQAKRMRASRRPTRSGGRARTPRPPRPDQHTAPRRSPASHREGIREVFLAFASDFAAAESRAEIVRVLSNVDSYVARVEKLVGR